MCALNWNKVRTQPIRVCGVQPPRTKPAAPHSLRLTRRLVTPQQPRQDGAGANTRNCIEGADARGQGAFDKDAKVTDSMEKRPSFQPMMQEQLVICVQECKNQVSADAHLTPYAMVNADYIIDLVAKPEMQGFRRKYCGLGLGKDFLGGTAKP